MASKSPKDLVVGNAEMDEGWKKDDNNIIKG